MGDSVLNSPSREELKRRLRVGVPKQSSLVVLSRQTSVKNTPNGHFLYKELYLAIWISKDHIELSEKIQVMVPISRSLKYSCSRALRAVILLPGSKQSIFCAIICVLAMESSWQETKLLTTCSGTGKYNTASIHNSKYRKKNKYHLWSKRSSKLV